RFGAKNIGVELIPYKQDLLPAKSPLAHGKVEELRCGLAESCLHRGHYARKKVIDAQDLQNCSNIVAPSGSSVGPHSQGQLDFRQDIAHPGHEPRVFEYAVFSHQCLPEVEGDGFYESLHTDRLLEAPSILRSDPLACRAKRSVYGDAENDGVGGEKKSAVAPAGGFLNSRHEGSQVGEHDGFSDHSGYGEKEHSHCPVSRGDMAPA